jgi:nicotinate-nucleotide adenylyltransferase
VRRPGWVGPPPDAGWNVVEVDVPSLEVSSSDLRARFADGRPVDWLTPQSVVRIVEERGLYRLAR